MLFIMGKLQKISKIDDDFKKLVEEIRACNHCAANLPLGANPIFRAHLRLRY